MQNFLDWLDQTAEMFAHLAGHIFLLVCSFILFVAACMVVGCVMLLPFIPLIIMKKRKSKD